MKNLNLKAIETLPTKDALAFVNHLLEEFHSFSKVYTVNHLTVTDKEFPKMEKVMVLVQAFTAVKSGQETPEEQNFTLTLSRGKDWSCSNGVNATKMSKAGFQEEAYAFMRIKELF